MTEICFEPGATAQDVAEALNGLSGRLAADTPVLALGGRHAAEAAQVVFASTSIMRLFGASALAALTEAIGAGRASARSAGGTAAQRLRGLAETLPPDGPARLERLHFEIDGMDQAVTFLCRRLSVAGAPPLFVAAALDPPSAPSASPEGSAPGRANGPAAVRFLWRTDADHRMANIDARRIEVAGAAGGDLVGDGLVETVARFDPETAAQFSRLLERRESFSGVEIVWPMAGAPNGVPITIAGAPSFDDQRRFIGFRGFGLIGRERLLAAKLAARKEAEDMIQPPPPLAPTAARRQLDPVAMRRPESARAGVEAELRHYQREARELDAILDTAMDGVAVLDAQGRIVALNRSGEALFGFDKAEVAGEAFTILFAPESRERALSYFEGLKSCGVASLLNDGREVLGLTRQGGAIPLFMTLGRIGAASATDQEARYCALLRDMTHWKMVERELDEARRQAEQASALKSDFLAKVSHEIRTPLNAILGFAEVIMEERFGPIGNDRYKDYLKDIHSSGALVLSLVNDLLDLSKIEAGKIDLSKRSTPIALSRNASRSCSRRRAPRASSRGCRWRRSCRKSAPTNARCARSSSIFCQTRSNSRRPAAR